MAEKENQFQGVVESLLKGMDTVLSTKTVVGEATQIGDTIILPLVDVTFGVGAGAGSNAEKNSASGAGGLGGKMTPSAVLDPKIFFFNYMHLFVACSFLLPHLSSRPCYHLPPGFP